MSPESKFCLWIVLDNSTIMQKNSLIPMSFDSRTETLFSKAVLKKQKMIKLDPTMAANT